MTFRGFPLLPSAKLSSSSLVATVGQIRGALLLDLTNHCRIQCTVEFGLTEDSIKTKQEKLKTVCNTRCSHTVLMPIQAFCNVTEFRLVTSSRRFGGAFCLHLDCQAVKQRYMIQSTLGFVSKPALLGMQANLCVQYESANILQWNLTYGSYKNILLIWIYFSGTNGIFRCVMCLWNIMMKLNIRHFHSIFTNHS